MRHVIVLLIACIACSGDAPAAAPAEPAKPEAPKPPPPPPKPEPILVQGGLSKPESALHDTTADVYLVSNIVGKSGEKDGKGFISRVSPEGEILALRWIDGLDAPKGMGIAGDALYVADLDRVRIFDRESGKARGSVKIKGATFLNDIAVDGSGNVFVSDSGLEQYGPYMEPNGKDAVYRLEGKKAVKLIGGKQLGNPDGLLADGAALYVVNKPGELYRVEGGSKGAATKLPKGSLDGIVKTEAGLMISSWDAKAVFLQKDDGFVPATAKINSPADIGYDAKRKRLLIPLLTEKTLRIEPLQ